MNKSLNFLITRMLGILLLFPFLISCKKEKKSIQYSAILTNTSYDFYKIKKANAHTFYLCGGVKGSGLIMKSIDTGSTWTMLQNNFPGIIFDIDFNGSQKMIASCEKITFFISNDDWQSWVYVIPPAGEYPLTGYDSDMFSIDMVNDSIGFSCGGTVYPHGVIYRTTDGGITWRYTYKEHEMKSILMFDAVTGYASGYGVIYKTADGGLNWKVTDAADDYYTGLALAGTNQVFAAGYQGSLVTVYNGGESWSRKNKSNKPFEKRIHFNCINFFDEITGVAAGTNGTIYITSDGGENWEAGTAFDGTQINSIVLTAANSGLAAGVNGKIYKFQF